MTEKTSEKIKQPKVGILVISWNCFDLIKQCIEGIHAIDYTNYEIIILDNGSQDDSVQKIKTTFPNLKLICFENNMGWGYAINRAIEYGIESGCEYFLSINGDAFLEKDTLTAMVDKIEKDPMIGLLSPVLYFYNTPEKIQYCGSTIEWNDFIKRNFDNLKDLNKYRDEDLWLWGTALLISRKCIKKIGLINEKYFVYCEDMDYSIRALKAGFKVKILETAKALHKAHGLDEGDKTNLPLHWYFYITRNEYWFWQTFIPKSQKFRLKRKYIAKICNAIGHCKNQGHMDIIDAYCDGLHWAFNNIRGGWDKEIKMPGFYKKLILKCPFFWTDLLEFRFAKIGRSVLTKCKLRKGMAH